MTEISRFLGVQPSAAYDMITLLVRKGKLFEIVPVSKFCADCGLRSDCNLLAARGKRFVRVPPVPSCGVVLNLDMTKKSRYKKRLARPGVFYTDYNYCAFNRRERLLKLRVTDSNSSLEVISCSTKI